MEEGKTKKATNSDWLKYAREKERKALSDLPDDTYSLDTAKYQLELLVYGIKTPFTGRNSEELRERYQQGVDAGILPDPKTGAFTRDPESQQTFTSGEPRIVTIKSARTTSYSHMEADHGPYGRKTGFGRTLSNMSAPAT